MAEAAGRPQPHPQPQPQPQRVQYIVTVQGRYLDRIDEVAKMLASAGLDVERVLGTLGQVLGSAGEAAGTALGAVPGVQSVDRARQVRLGPPQGPIQ